MEVGVRRLTVSFGPVTREIRSLVARRRELLTMLGSIFAGMGIFLENTLHGNLPASLRAFSGRIFEAYAVMLLFPSLILALRLARLNAGMAFNGIYYARLMQEQKFTTAGDPAAAGRINFRGVSFLMFLLTDMIAGFSAALLCLTVADSSALAALVGSAVFSAWLFLYVRFHGQSVEHARRRLKEAAVESVTRGDWLGHMSGSLEDANHDMTAVVSLVGLIIFSALQSLSGLGGTSVPTDLPPDLLAKNASTVYGALMTATCLTGMVTYVRLRLAAGAFSLALDPEDEPFRLLHVNDSLLGYALLAFLFALSIHFLLSPWLGAAPLAGAVIAAFAGALACEQAAVAAASGK